MLQALIRLSSSKPVLERGPLSGYFPQPNAFSLSRRTRKPSQERFSLVLVLKLLLKDKDIWAQLLDQRISSMSLFEVRLLSGSLKSTNYHLSPSPNPMQPSPLLPTISKQDGATSLAQSQVLENYFQISRIHRHLFLLRFWVAQSRTMRENSCQSPLVLVVWVFRIHPLLLRFPSNCLVNSVCH